MQNMNRIFQTRLEINVFYNFSWEDYFGSQNLNAGKLLVTSLENCGKVAWKQNDNSWKTTGKHQKNKKRLC